jgi:hypothetical protein
MARIRRWGIWPIGAAVVACAALTHPAVGTAPPVTASLKSQQYYVLGAHPDDPIPSWAWVEHRPPTDYLVFVSLTRSEGTLACVTPEDAVAGTTPEDAPDADPIAGSEPNQFASLLYPITGQEWILPYHEMYSTGPYRYEGPDSPVGQEDHGERHPYGFPWEGQGSDACGRAQVATWHWFLDEAHSIDGIGTTMAVDDPWRDDDYRGRHCFVPFAKVQEQLPRRPKREVCAEVWANAESARVFFDLPDVYSGWREDGTQTYTHLTFDEDAVEEVLTFVRRSRATWRMPVLPEAGILGLGGYGDGKTCDAGASPTHKPILDLVRWHDLDIGEQAGPMSCAEDPYAQGAEHVSYPVMNPATLVAWNLVDPATGTRIGPLVKNFGWLLGSYAFDGCAGCDFWRRPT